MPNNVFKKTKRDKKTDSLMKKAVNDYITAHYTWLKPKKTYNAHAVRCYQFTITQPELGSDNRVIRNIADRISIVTDRDKCVSVKNGRTLSIIVPKTEKERDMLLIGDGIETYLDEISPAKGLYGYVGEKSDGTPAIVDLSDRPNMIIGGTTGSGKSTAMHAMLLSMMYRYSPQQLEVHIIDTKPEFATFYRGCPHVKVVATEMNDAMAIATNICDRVHERSRFMNGQNITDYNKANPNSAIPRVVLIMDESDAVLSEHMTGPAKMFAKEIRNAVRLTAAQGRMAGIHIIIASQKPDAKNIGTEIKSNIDTRLALKTTSTTDSRVILNATGAERLIGNGDAILQEHGVDSRVQCAYTSPSEIKDAVKELKRCASAGEPWQK